MRIDNGCDRRFKQGADLSRPSISFAVLRRYPITLLELLVVMAILAVVSGIVMISINKALIDQRFRTEVSQIVDELRLAQDFMLILGTDVSVHFEQAKDQDRIDHWIDFEIILPDGIQGAIARKRKPLKTIRGVLFRDLLDSKTEEGKLDIKFFSNGAVMSKGMMRLTTATDENIERGVLSSYICLTGYPRPIFSNDSKDVAEGVISQLDNDFDARLTQDTIHKLPEKLKQTDENQNDDSDDKKKEGKVETNIPPHRKQLPNKENERVSS